MNDEKNLSAHLVSQRESLFVHASFDREMAFYESICSGDIETVKMLATPLCSEGYGLLSRDEIRNIQYHFVISAAMIARFCIGSGMSPEEAYQLSDYYIIRADECRSVKAVHEVHTAMLEGYTRKMRLVRNKGIYSKQIVRAIDYISDHLHSRVRLEGAAAHLGLSEAYLSRLFKSEVGMTFNDYANRKKAEAAANLLRYSDYTDLEISNLLAFSSQSYFIKIFKRYMGVTPKEFKKTYRMPNLKNASEAALTKLPESQQEVQDKSQTPEAPDDLS